MELLEQERIAPKARPAVMDRPAPKAPVAPRRALGIAPVPTIHIRGRVVARPNRRVEAIVGRTVAFACVMGLTYVGSTLGGYVMLERARQSARHAADRATYARGEAKAARESIETLTNPAALRAWAESRGFVPGETVAAPEDTLVARR